MNEFIHTYIAFCCREWVAPLGYQGGTCGLCGEKPTFLREDPNSPLLIKGPTDSREAKS